MEKEKKAGSSSRRLIDPYNSTFVTYQDKQAVWQTEAVSLMHNGSLNSCLNACLNSCLNACLNV